MSIEKNEQEIISRAQDNPGSFAPIYDHYFPKIYNYIYQRVQNTQLTEDLVSETFYKALANINQFKWQGRSFASWLYTIARNQVIDQYRRKEPLILDESKNELMAPETSNPENKALDKVTQEEIFKTIKMLTPDQQDALLLRFQEDLKIREIAEVLGKNEGAVKALLFRGLKSLRKKLKEGGYNEAV
ncbi:MAG: sigma-70 family RNA polymerase sigma factor [Firmicutes bacterium]|nr:sigma-70 family RNA polymerase sigma factor [Bacillota bacterium]